MQHSDALDKLAPALVKARAAIGPVHKDSTNPHFKSSFASLSAISDAALPSLHANGITVVQSGGPGSDDAGLEVLTRLIHASGQWLETSVRMPLDKANPQGAGSALTYGRRYGLSAALGIVADEDDDGNAASSTPARSASAPRQQEARSPAPSPASSGDGPECPKCGGPMWDNRADKKSPKHPDYKCKDKTCKDDRGYVTAVWERDLMAEMPAALVPDEGPMPWDED